MTHFLTRREAAITELPIANLKLFFCYKIVLFFSERIFYWPCSKIAVQHTNNKHFLTVNAYIYYLNKLHIIMMACCLTKQYANCLLPLSL